MANYKKEFLYTQLEQDVKDAIEEIGLDLSNLEFEANLEDVDRITTGRIVTDTFSTTVDEFEDTLRGITNLDKKTAMMFKFSDKEVSFLELDKVLKAIKSLLNVELVYELCENKKNKEQKISVILLENM